MLYMKIVESKSLVLITRQKLFSVSLIFYLCETMDVDKTYCGNNFMMYVSQIIMFKLIQCHMSILCQ